MNILEIRDLSVSYGVHEAVSHVDMDIAQGSITAIIGSNGAGKTTIINAISGMVPRKGRITLNGAPLPEQANRVVKRGIVQVPEGRKIFAGLTVEENLRLGAYTVPSAEETTRLLQEQYELFPRLGERRTQDAGTLSGGEQQMLAICRGLMAKPKVLMLDEPSLGLAPVIVNDVFRTIQKIRDEGITVILVEQNAKRSLSICDYAYVIESGKLFTSGSGQQMLADPRIAAAYLGASRK